MVPKRLLLILILVLPLAHAYEDNVSSTGPVGESLVDLEDNRIILNVDTGETVIFEPRKGIAVSRIKIIFAEPATRVTLITKQYMAKPEQIPEAPSEVYKYLEIEHEGLEHAAGLEVVFRVPPAFFSDNQDEFTVWRLEGDEWVSYPPAVQGVDTRGNYVFTHDLPGLSWFALGFHVEESEPVSEPVNETVNETFVNETVSEPVSETVNETVEPVEVAEPEKEQPKSVIVKPESDQTKISPMMALFGLVALAIILTVGGLQAYRLYQKKHEEHQRVLEQDQKEYEIKKRLDSDHPFSELQEYILKMRSKNIEEGEIKRRLLNVGWDEVVIDQEIERLSSQ